MQETYVTIYSDNGKLLFSVTVKTEEEKVLKELVKLLNKMKGQYHAS